MSLRNSSGGSGLNLTPAPPLATTKRKNALAKESEFGVLGIKTPLLDVSAKAEEVWGPALGGRDKEETLKVVASSVDKYKEYYEVGGSIADSIKRKDYESLVEDYTRAKRFADEARKLGENIVGTKAAPTDAQIQQIIVAARMWHDVQEQIEDFRRDIWKRLIAVQGSTFGTSGGNASDVHMEYISILLELGVQDNPIWIWLLSRYDNLKNKISQSSERYKVEIEILRRRLAAGEKPTPQIIASHLRSLSRQGPGNKSLLDSAEVIELWERMHAFLSSMLSSKGILGEVLEFWQTVEGFLDGRTQKTLPVGLDGESRKHHKFSEQNTQELKKGTIELVDMIRESVYTFFVDPPIDDISALFSPLPTTPMTPKSASLTPTALREPRLAYDANNLPPPSPRRGEAWEKFAFWPPWSNSLSGVHYLARLLVLVGAGASEMASIAPVVAGDGSALERLRSLVGSARERCVTAICAAWNKDAENVKVLEDWMRSPEKRDLTRMPSYFMAFESGILSGMQKILYISEAMAKPGSEEVVLPPPAKLLQMVRSQFVTTLYKALSGMVENAERSMQKTDDDWTTEAEGLASPVATISPMSIGSGIVNANDRVSYPRH
jgi:exocyst complex component 2